ncbi:MAG: hypothetical protein ACOYD0_11405 [Candidatus Nanopelagicales bacterium]
MSNPGPRPALRKAPDADLHPAEADKSRQAVVIDLAERSIGLPDAPRVSNDKPSPSVAPTRPRRSISTPRQDVPVADEVRAVGDAPVANDKASKGSAASKERKLSKKQVKAQKKADKKAREAAKDAAKRSKGTNKSKDKKGKKANELKRNPTADLAGETISDPRIALKSSISRKTRQDMRAEAKARGTSLDGTVDSVVTDLRNR